MCTTRGERRLISFRCQKECVESKLDGQTDSHSVYSANPRVVQNFYTKSIRIVDKDNFDLHIFQFNIDFAIFGSFLRFKFSQQPLNSRWKMLEYISMQNLIKMNTVWFKGYEHFHKLTTTSPTDAQQSIVHQKRLLRMSVVRQC